MGKVKQFFEDFKAFALKGNVLDMSIGVIIGGAFSSIVTALTDNLINPIIGILMQTNLDNVAWDVFGDGRLVFGFGAFISAVINFVIMAFVLFCIVRFAHSLMDAAKKQEEEAPAAPAGPTQEELLAQILDELKAQNAAAVK